MTTIWRKTVKRIHREACALLEENELPTTYEELIAHDETRDRLVSLAILLVYSCHWIEKELEKGRCERALDRLTDIYSRYEDFFLLSNSQELIDDPLLTDDMAKYVTKGKRRFGWQSNKKTPEEEIQQWREEYQQILKDNPNISKRKAAEMIDPSKIENIRKKI